MDTTDCMQKLGACHMIPMPPRVTGKWGSNRAAGPTQILSGPAHQGSGKEQKEPKRNKRIRIERRTDRARETACEGQLMSDLLEKIPKTRRSQGQSHPG